MNTGSGVGAKSRFRKRSTTLRRTVRLKLSAAMRQRKALQAKKKRALKKRQDEQDASESAISASIDSLRRAVEQRREVATRESEKINVPTTAIRQRLRAAYAQRQELIESMLPRLDKVPTTAATLQARRAAVAKTLLLERWGAYTSSEMGQFSGSNAKNVASTASRWKAQGKIFAVPYKGKTYFPSFQFDENGQPIPVVAEILSGLGRKVESWELALWFDAANGWLGGAKPVSLLATDPEAVSHAAQREAEELAG